MRQLTDYQMAEALDSRNRFYTWIALGRPQRHVTEEECIRHYAENASYFKTFEVKPQDPESDGCEYVANWT